MTKDMQLKALSKFFASKGVKTMDLAEYKAVGNDVPVKDYMLRRAFGSWNRVLSAQNNRYPVVLAEPKKVAPKPAPKKVVKKEKKDVK